MPNWTPGPWKLWGMQVCTAAKSDEKQLDNSDVVADTYQRNEHGRPITRDAQLIATAPELYAALEAVLPILYESDALLAMYSSGSRARIPAELITQVETVLARAQGEQ